LQPPGTGVGPLVRKQFTTGPLSSTLSAAEIISEIRGDINKFSHDYILQGISPVDTPFSCVAGSCGTISLGNTYHIDGPLWFNPYVEVTSVTPTSFQFTTLEGHPEAGSVTFSASDSPAGPIFTISVVGQPSTRGYELLYNLPVIGGTHVQDQVWQNFAQNVRIFANAN
jgi:hypothetical protein